MARIKNTLANSDRGRAQQAQKIDNRQHALKAKSAAQGMSPEAKAPTKRKGKAPAKAPAKSKAKAKAKASAKAKTKSKGKAKAKAKAKSECKVLSDGERRYLANPTPKLRLDAMPTTDRHVTKEELRLHRELNFLWVCMYNSMPYYVDHAAVAAQLGMSIGASQKRLSRLSQYMRELEEQDQVPAPHADGEDAPGPANDAPNNDNDAHSSDAEAGSDNEDAGQTDEDASGDEDSSDNDESSSAGH